MVDSLTIIYNGTPLLINPKSFAESSVVFASYYDPTSNEELNIVSEIPLAAFMEFLPAVQRRDLTITDDNVASLRRLAEEWDVASLRAECDRWENSPGVLLSHLIAALQQKDRLSIVDLTGQVAEQINECLQLGQFTDVHPKAIGDILSHANCKVRDPRELLQVLLTIVKSNPKASSLINFVPVEALTPEEIERVITQDGVELGSMSTFLVNAAERFIHSGRQSRDRLQKLDAQLQKVERQAHDTAGAIRGVQRNLEDERIWHDEHRKQLDAMMQKYEPARPPGGSKKGRAGKRRGGGSPFVYVPEPPPEAPKAEVPKPEPPKPEVPRPDPRPQAQKSKAGDGKRQKKGNPFSWSPEDDG